MQGCFSAGETVEMAMENACQAIEQHVEVLIGVGAQIPAPRSLAHWQDGLNYAG